MNTENEDIFVAYSITDKEPIPLGYCVIDKLNISHSRYIETLFQNTANFNNTEVNIELFNCIQKKKCVHISHWIFDENLRDIKILKSIFSHLMSYARNSGEYDFIWYDGKNEIIYYPIEDIDYVLGYKYSSNYFALSFYNE